MGLFPGDGDLPAGDSRVDISARALHCAEAKDFCYRCRFLFRAPTSCDLDETRHREQCLV